MSDAATPQGAPRRLLVVAHVPSPNTTRLRDAVLRGARSPEIANVEVAAKPPLEAGPPPLGGSGRLMAAAGVGGSGRFANC